MLKLIIKAFENVLFNKNKKTYPESKRWRKIKGTAWNFNDLLKLVLQGAVYILLIFIVFFTINKLFSGTIGIIELFN